MNPVSMKLELATCEPYFDYIHSGTNTDNFIVIYSYVGCWVLELEWWGDGVMAGDGVAFVFIK
jgi:hypothetical protein